MAATNTSQKLTATVGDIHPSSGLKAPNKHDDVVLVQTLLRKLKLYTAKVDGKCGKLSVEAIHKFQKNSLKWSTTDGRVDPGGKTFAALLKAAAGARRYTIKYGKNFVKIVDGKALDATLLDRTKKLGQYLIDNDLVTGNIVYGSGIRSAKVCHLWSTAYNIQKGRVSLESLQALKNGKDLDGNVWYKKDWEKGLAKDKKGEFTKESRAALGRKVYALARSYWSGPVAAEGYALTDKRILPNGHKVQSNHLSGKAVDITIPWKSGASLGAKFNNLKITNGSNSDAAANALVKHFKLLRPVKKERHHFQI